jgi:hypothetical protein
MGTDRYPSARCASTGGADHGPDGYRMVIDPSEAPVVLRIFHGQSDQGAREGTQRRGGPRTPEVPARMVPVNDHQDSEE